jgi:hypothetical protein
MDMLGGISVLFPLPRTRDFDFNSAYTAGSHELAQFLTHATVVRANMARFIAVGDAERTVESINAYLPILESIKEMSSRSDGLLQPRSLPAFTWTSGCDKKPSTQEYTLHGIVYETAMLLSVLAYAQGNLAAVLFSGIQSDEDFDPVAKRAAILYRSSAGICNYISESVLPLNSLPYHRPPEVLPDCHRALSFIFRCSAQQVQI